MDIFQFAKENADIPRCSLPRPPVMPIAYSEEFLLTMELVRGASKLAEVSSRILTLLWLGIKVNPANYTLWTQRRKVLFALFLAAQPTLSPSWLHDELHRTGEIARKSPKNFQLWHHRRVVLEYIDGTGTSPNQVRASAGKGDLCDIAVPSHHQEELNLCSDVLFEDAKNYHVWSHRKWVFEHILRARHGDPSPETTLHLKEELLQRELEYTTSRLYEDIYNNSAWCYRVFLIHTANNDGLSLPFPIHDALCELDTFIIPALRIALDNESPFSYLRAVWCEARRAQGTSDLGPIHTLSELYTRLCEFYQTEVEESLSQRSPSNCHPHVTVPILWALHDLYAELPKDVGDMSENPWLRRLSEVDTIRSQYWNEKLQK